MDTSFLNGFLASASNSHALAPYPPLPEPGLTPQGTISSFAESEKKDGKQGSGDKRPNALDFRHHLSAGALVKEQSPLKELYRFAKPTTLQLSGGLPNPSYFPLNTLSADVLLNDSFPPFSPSNSNLSPRTSLARSRRTNKNDDEEPSTHTITIPKFPEPTPTPPPPKPDDPEKAPITLSTLLQYGQASGTPQLSEFLYRFTAKMLKPAFKDFRVFVTSGNTDACYKAFNMLIDPLSQSPYILSEFYTFPSIIAGTKPLNAKWLGIPVDEEGMIPEELEKVLSQWPEVGVRKMFKGGEAFGGRPRVMYTITVGQNPTGGTLSMERRKKIYDICCRYDVVIVEDDPYTYISEDWLSYLSIDYQGRVIRCDTFSKVIAPGSRLGWITANPLFVERIWRHAEINSQNPSGFSQAVIAKIVVQEWGMDKWLRWLRGLVGEYAKRRIAFCEALDKEFGLVQGKKAISSSSFDDKNDREEAFVTTLPPRSVDGDWIDVAPRHSLRVSDLVSFTPPTAGMFVWLRINVENHPRYVGSPDSVNNGLELIDQLWERFAVEADILIGPGRMFAANDFVRPYAVFYRIAFSLASEEELVKAAKAMREITVDFFKQ